MKLICIECETENRANNCQFKSLRNKGVKATTLYRLLVATIVRSMNIIFISEYDRHTYIT